MSLDLDNLKEQFCTAYHNWQRANLDCIGYQAREVLWQQYVKVRNEFLFLRDSKPHNDASQRILIQQEAKA